MSRRAPFSQSEVTCLVRGAIRGGWPVGSFKVVVENGHPALLPIAANSSSDDAAEMARRMREAFGDE